MRVEMLRRRVRLMQGNEMELILCTFTHMQIP